MEMSVAQVQGVFDRATLLHPKEEVEAAISKMARAITVKLHDQNPVVLCVMNGGLITTANLVTELEFPLQLDYLHASRYRGETSGADLQWQRVPQLSLEGRTVLIVDDIFDEGTTLESIVSHCNQAGAAQVFTAVLTDKLHSRKKTSLKVDFVGLAIADAYVFGYGLDYKGYLRNAAGIYAISDRDY
ncbi:MAG: hypoxanthine-guanine phosphoribosyltransferase [Pseudohongiellaceae bacterium]